MPLFDRSSGFEAFKGLSSASICRSHRASVFLAQPQVIPAIHPQLILQGLSQSPMYSGTARDQAISSTHLFSNPLVEGSIMVLLLLFLQCHTLHNNLLIHPWPSSCWPAHRMHSIMAAADSLVVLLELDVQWD